MPRLCSASNSCRRKTEALMEEQHITQAQYDGAIKDEERLKAYREQITEMTKRYLPQSSVLQRCAKQSEQRRRRTFPQCRQRRRRCRRSFSKRLQRQEVYGRLLQNKRCYEQTGAQWARYEQLGEAYLAVKNLSDTANGHLTAGCA